MTKAGDSYLRRLLILSTRAVLAAAANKQDSLSRWAMALAERRGHWKAVVAIAAENARMACAMLAKGEDFKPLAGSIGTRTSPHREALDVGGATTEHRICHRVTPALMGQGWTCAGSARLTRGGAGTGDRG